jgi:hypothetical protein
MRLVYRSERNTTKSNVVRMPHSKLNIVDNTIDQPELTAFRGFLIAATFSALFWGICLTAVWLLRTRP